jgi:hypothetical protein
MDILEEGCRVALKAQNGRGARKTAAGAGFFPNYPILGIGRVEVIAYASTALNFPVQSVFFKPPGTAIRWLFLLAPAKCRRFA